MEKRLYFIVGDVLSNVVIGALAAVSIAGLIGPAWNMLLGMIVGMIVGMAESLLAPLTLCPFFGAMEVMLPTMVTGMVAGMVLGMRAVMQPVYFSQAAGLGALVGIGTLLLVLVVNAKLQGEVG